MNKEKLIIIRAECNFIEEDIEQIYIGRKLFTSVMRNTMHKRLQSIRDIIREEENIK